jgi:peptide/nickel transport system substrate-binding protein
MYKNRGPVKFDRMSIKIVPEESSRVAAMMSGKFDFTNAYPAQFVFEAKKAPMLQVHQALPNFQLSYLGFKITRPMVSDKRVREAMSIAINRAEIAKGVALGNAEPAYTIVHPTALDFAPTTKTVIKENVERAKKLLDEAGWKTGSDGIREKDGVKLAPRLYYTVAGGLTPKTVEAVQGYLRKIGVDLKLVGWDSNITFAKMAEQDYEIWSVPVPYMSAGDLLNVYFDSKNIPSPNRMNYKDSTTDALLATGRTALTEADRAKAYAQVQERVMAEHLFMPVLNVHMYLVTSKRLKGARPHMLYQNTFYKGLDLSF